MKIAVCKSRVRFDLKTECPRVTYGLFGTNVAKHTCFTLENVTPVMVCVATLGQGPLRQSTKHFGLKTYKSGAFPSKGPNLRCRLSSRPSHQSVGHFRLKAQSVQHFRLKAGPGRPDAPNKPSESHSGHIWRQAAQMLKMRPLRPLLAMSGARAPRCSNRAPEIHSDVESAQLASWRAPQQVTSRRR